MAAPTSLYDLLSEYVFPMISESILAQMGPREVIMLTRTCKAFAGHYKKLWNVDRRLRRFVNDPVGLRAALGRYDGLIAGGFATQFFDRVLWPESDLDIFATDARAAEGGRSAAAICEYLIQREQYRDIDGESMELYQPDGLRDLRGVRNLQKKTKSGETRKIQVVSMRSDALRGVLADFYSTTVTSLITATKAYHLFPRSTFIERKAFYLKPCNEYTELMAKYEARGFQVQLRDEASSRPRVRDFAQHRRLGGRDTWTIAFENSELPAPHLPDSVREYACFALERGPAGQSDQGVYQAPHFEVYVSAEPLQAHPLRHRYVCSDRGFGPDFWQVFGRNFWQDFAGPYLDWLAYERFCALPPGARPDLFHPHGEEGYNHYGPSIRHICNEDDEAWTPGPDWRFLDDKIPQIFEEFERVGRRGPVHMVPNGYLGPLQINVNYCLQLHARLGHP